MGATASTGVTEELGHVQSGNYPFPDPGLTLDPPIIAGLPDDVSEVRVDGEYRLFVRFFDGTCGWVEMKERILSPCGHVFASLANPAVFAQVGLGFGTVMWANGMDLAPDVMYEEFKKNGKWVLR